MRPDGVKVGPRWRQEGAKTSQNGPRWGQDGMMEMMTMAIWSHPGKPWKIGPPRVPVLGDHHSPKIAPKLLKFASIFESFQLEIETMWKIAPSTIRNQSQALQLKKAKYCVSLTRKQQFYKCKNFQF